MYKKDMLLITMAYLGQVYRQDFTSMLRDGNKNSSRIVKTLLQDGLISEREVSIVGGESNKKTVVISITRKGRNYLANKFDDNVYVDIAKDVQKLFNTSDAKLLQRRFAINRVKVSMINAGALVLPPDKPSLTKLYYDAAGYKYEKKETLYDNDMEIEETLNQGVYYSWDEIKDFFYNIGDDENYDIMLGSRLRGIYLNQESTIICYISNIAKNRKIKLQHSVEQRTIRILTQRLSLLNGISALDALVICNGDALVPKMTPAVKDKEGMKFSMLDWNNKLFEKIYVFPKTQTGNDSMNYLFTHNLSEWINESKQVFNNISFMEAIEGNVSNKILVGRNKLTGNRVVFMPWYEMKILKFINEFHEQIDVVTSPKMAEAIMKSIHRNILIYDMEGNLILVSEMDKHKPNKIEKKKVRRVKQYSICLSRDDRKKLEKIAKQKGMSFSKFVRNQLRQIIKEENIKEEIEEMLEFE